MHGAGFPLLMGAPEGKVEPDGTYQAPRHGWTCFHCGETFSIATHGSHAQAVQGAREHFGPDPRWTPACIELMQSKPQQLYRRLRRAEIKLAEYPNLEEQVDYLSDVAQENHDLRAQLDSLRGELEVERLRLREAR